MWPLDEENDECTLPCYITLALGMFYDLDLNFNLSTSQVQPVRNCLRLRVDPLHLWVAARAWRSSSPLQYQGHHQGDDDADDEACDDACDDEASSAEPTASMLIWTFRFKRHGNLSFFIVHFSSGTRKWPDSEMKARNHWSFGCENCLGEKQTFDPRGNKDLLQSKPVSQYFCSSSVVFHICMLLWLEPGCTNRLSANLKQIWGG